MCEFSRSVSAIPKMESGRLRIRNPEREGTRFMARRPRTRWWSRPVPRTPVPTPRSSGIRLRSRYLRLRTLSLLVALCTVVPTVPAGADDSDPAGIGIKLLEAPTNRRDDPRARAYIVDHLVPGSVIKRRVQVENNTTEQR